MVKARKSIKPMALHLCGMFSVITPGDMFGVYWCTTKYWIIMGGHFK